MNFLDIKILFAVINFLLLLQLSILLTKYNNSILP